MAAHVASLRCISLIIKGFTSLGQLIHVANTFKLLPFACNGLSPSRTTTEAPPASASRSHAPLTSVADLPRFTCLDSAY